MGGNPMTTSTHKNRQQGMSMVELMVALTIGLVIMAAASTVFVNANRNYQTTDSMGRMQENVRTALAALGRDIRLAGYFGCRSEFDNINSTLNGGGFGGSAQAIPLLGFEGCPASGTCTVSDT